MATTKTNRQAKAEINRQIKELLKVNKQLKEQAKKIREQERENLEAIKKLKERKRELKEKDCKKSPINKDTPIYKIAYSYKYDDLRDLIDIWQKGVKEKIDIKTAFFNFDPKFKPRFIRSLAEIFRKDIPVFKVSINQVFKYLQEHTNLGRWDSLKRAVNRENQKSRDMNLYKGNISRE
ncbi:MAG: hypothetical protein K6G32_12430 [Prevotella sp.]|jgi:hypothetical protein|nr:hypothetical protein [Prevotella sp.]